MDIKEHIFPAATDHGTVLEPNQVAVVYDPDKGYQILIPDNEEADIPDRAVALIAAAVRLQDDEDFYNELLSWFEERESE